MNTATKHGGRVYPSYDTDGEKEVIQNDYTFNALGQQTQTKVTLTSAKTPSDNRSYVEEKTTYDSFGNEISTPMKTDRLQKLPMMRKPVRKPKPSVLWEPHMNPKIRNISPQTA